MISSRRRTEDRALALNYAKLLEFDGGRLHDLDRRVDNDVNRDVDEMKRAIEASREKKLKKARKRRKQEQAKRGLN